MKSLYKLIILIFVVTSSLLLYSCSGCSKSGLKSRADSNQQKTDQRSSRNSNSTQTAPSIKQPIPQTSSQNKSANNSGKTLSELYQECKPAVILIYTSDGVTNLQGSGFFINNHGVAVSNYHVFKGTLKSYAQVKMSNGDTYNVLNVLEKSENNDYIIFQVDVQNTPYLKIASITPEIGEEVFAIGNPQGLEHTLSEGIVSSYRKNNQVIQITAEITHGSSGGPLLNMNGEVVGITSSGMGEADLNFAMNILLLNVNKYQ